METVSTPQESTSSQVRSVLEWKDKSVFTRKKPRTGHYYSLRARSGSLNKIDKSVSVQSPAKITSPRASTTALIKWKEITPQEKKRRIKTKGEQFMK